MCEWCKDYDEWNEANKNRDWTIEQRFQDWSKYVAQKDKDVADLGPMYEDDTGWGPMYEHYYVEDEFAQWVEYQKKGRIRRWLKKMMDFHM